MEKDNVLLINFYLDLNPNTLLEKYTILELGYNEETKNRKYWKQDFTIKELKFHKDWNWLIRLIKKIEEACKKINYPDPFGLEHSLNPFVRKQEEIYNSCVEFVKYYNHVKNSKS
jgi:hypothetical protein